MGIFSNKHGQAVQGNGSPSTDGFLSASSDQAMQNSIDDMIGPNTPDPAHISIDDQADYILTEDPVITAPPVVDEHPVPVSVNNNHVKDKPVHDDLGVLKQQVLEELTPLVSHLDQSPEEKFHTTMMLMQATDDQSLVKDAYEAAQQITDKKARAQALLDIVNEINYFSSQQKQH